MVKGCGGHPTLDSCIPGHRIVVRYCVVERTQFSIPYGMATMGMVLDGYCWCTV